MKKLRIQFSIFFLLLQVGILFLLLNSYRQMRIEEKSLWESESTKVYNQVQAQISDMLNLEDARSFKEYRFYQNQTQSSISNLSNMGYPKGWIGYFQVDPDGSFTTPYLAPSEKSKSLPDYSLRLNKQKEIEKETLSFRKEMKGAFADRSIHEMQKNAPLKSPVASPVEGVGRNLNKVESEKPKSAPNIYPNPINSKKQEQRAAPVQVLEGGEDQVQSAASQSYAGFAPQLARREEAVPQGSIKTFEQNTLAPADASQETRAEEPSKTSEKSQKKESEIALDGDVKKNEMDSSDSFIKGNNNTEVKDSEPVVKEESKSLNQAELPSEKLPKKEKEKPKPSTKKGLTSTKGSSYFVEERRETNSSTTRVRAPSSVVWLDPFQAKVSGSSLIFFRRVWVEEKMYLQGFVLQIQEFFEFLMQNSFENSDLPRFSSVRWMLENEWIAQYGRIEFGPQKENVLFSRWMDYPLGSICWRIMGSAWPQISTRFYLNIFSGGLFLFATLGLFWIYRSSAAHILLSQKRQDFVSAVSHELKTPLTSIRMYSEMLEDGWVKDESKKQEYYKNIRQESERLSRLIENVLQMARLEKQSYHLNLVRQNPQQDLLEWEKQFKELASREGFKFELKIENEISEMEYDPEALKEVLLILLENSIKFSKTSVRKEVGLMVKNIESSVCLIWRDYGPGVPSKELKQIFEKFYRVENELTRKTKGTGIGLAIAKSTLEAMGAKIEASSASEGGLQITLFFRELV